MEQCNSHWLWVPLGANVSPYRQMPAELRNATTQRPVHHPMHVLSQGCSIISPKAGFCILSQLNYLETTLANPQLCTISCTDLPALGVAMAGMASSAWEQPEES